MTSSTDWQVSKNISVSGQQGPTDATTCLIGEVSGDAVGVVIVLEQRQPDVAVAKEDKERIRRSDEHEASDVKLSSFDQ